jgi:hypothetical protein
MRSLVVVDNEGASARLSAKLSSFSPLTAAIQTPPFSQRVASSDNIDQQFIKFFGKFVYFI